METPKYNKVKAFNNGIADAVRYALGPKEDKQPDKFRDKYTESASNFVEAGNREAFESFVSSTVNPMVQAMIQYQASPNDPRVFEDIGKAVEQLNAPRDDYLEKKVPQTEIDQVLTTDEMRKQYEEILKREVEKTKGNVRKGTLLSRLIL